MVIVRKPLLLVVLPVLTIACSLTPSAIAHDDGTETVEEHLQMDSVTLTPAKEQRLQLRSEEATAGDAAAAAAAVGDDAATVGQWGDVMDWPVVGIHVALLDNGKVLAYDSIDDDPTESHEDAEHVTTRAFVWDPKNPITGVRADVSTGVNIFCSGLAHLIDGTLLIAGGNKNRALNGIKTTQTFDSADNSWTKGDDMAYERWYPTVTPLSDGEMLIADGIPDGFAAASGTHEVRELDGGFRQLNDAVLDLPLYPWFDVAPDGRAFLSGPGPTMRSLDPSGTGEWEMHGDRDDEDRSYGGHALFDIGKILVAGGGYVSRTARVIDLNQQEPTSTPTGSMEFARRQHNLTVLADGTVLATGGHSSTVKDQVDLEKAVYPAELWDPETGQWTTLAAMERTRQYHSTTLLLPDATVVSSGGGICQECTNLGYHERNAEVFSPPYLFDGDGSLATRPEITAAPDVVGYDTSFQINTPQPSSIGDVALVRLGAVTHSVDMEQRYVPLDFRQSNGAIAVDAPPDANVAPPGVYMLFVIDSDGVPSEAEMVRVADVPATPPETPEIQDTDPESPSNVASPRVTGTAPAHSIVKIYGTADCQGTPLNEGAAADFNGSTGITVDVLGDQTTSLRATATDAAGNTSACSGPFAYTEDSTPPETAIMVAVDGATATAFLGADEGATFECALDSAQFSSCRSPKAYADLPAGSHALRVRATDLAGNTDPTPAQQSFEIAPSQPPGGGSPPPGGGPADLTAPETEITDGPKRKGTKRKARFRFASSEPGSTFRCRVDGKAKPCGERLVIKVRPGRHRLTVAATDAAGNADPSPAAYSWKVKRRR